MGESDKLFEPDMNLLFEPVLESDLVFVMAVMVGTVPDFVCVFVTDFVRVFDLVLDFSVLSSPDFVLEPWPDLVFDLVLDFSVSLMSNNNLFNGNHFLSKMFCWKCEYSLSCFMEATKYCLSDLSSILRTLFMSDLFETEIGDKGLGDGDGDSDGEASSYNGWIIICLLIFALRFSLKYLMKFVLIELIKRWLSASIPNALYRYNVALNCEISIINNTDSTDNSWLQCLVFIGKH